MNFDLTWYFLFNKPQSPFDAYLFHVDEMLDVFEQNTTSTTELYRNEYGNAKSLISESIKKQVEDARIIYKQAYDEIEGDDYEKDNYASNKAGYQEIQEEDHYQHEQLLRKFQEMTDHFNKSSLAMTYSMLESQFRRYCELLKDITDQKLSIDDLEQSNYLLSMFNYLEKVIGLPMKSLEKFKLIFKELQFLRNKIMHNGAEFPNNKNEELKTIITKSDKLLVLEKERTPSSDWDAEETISPYYILRVKKIEYLHRYFEAISSFFNELFWLSDALLKHQPIAGRIKHVASFLSKDISITDTMIADVKKGKNIRATITSANLEKPFNIKISITVTRAAKASFQITNQYENFEKLARLTDYIRWQPKIVTNEILQGFFMGKGKRAISVIFS
jgi:hypothetical protein